MIIETKYYPFKISGSFVIAAVGTDGIIMASEARANIFDKNDIVQTPIAYFDTIQKVFPKENIAIAETGQGVISNVFFSAIINDFYRMLVDCNAHEVLPAFIDYANRFLPKEIQQEFFNQKLFSAGFHNSIPIICYYDKEQTPKIGCKTNGFIQSDRTIFSDNYSINMNCQELAELAEAAIKEYASHNDRWKTIGGPVYVLKITKTNTEWILNKPVKQKWNYINEFIYDYTSEKIEINIIDPHTKDDLHKILGI
jgi:hypothetical protein